MPRRLRYGPRPGRAGHVRADLFDEPRTAGQDWTPCGHGIAREYRYVDEAGELLFAVVRCPRKCFPQWRPDPTAKSSRRWKLGDVRRVLYRLPEVVTAVAAGREVWIVEGEKDADRLAGLGLPATCNPGGAGKWRPEFTETLRGATVAIVADVDGPGRAHAQTVAAALRGADCKVRILEAKQGKDASDHIDAGHGLDDFTPFEFAAEQVEPAGDQGEQDERKPSQATILVRIARAGYRLVIGDDGRPYAVSKDGPQVARPLRGANGLRKQLARQYADQHHGAAPSQSALADALTVLEGYADDAHPEPIHLRVAPYLGGVAIDLGTPDGRCILVDGHQWVVMDRAPVLFRRTNLTAPMHEPTRGDHGSGKLRGLDPLLDLINADDERRQVLVGFLLSALIPNMPHPILALFGEQGTAKSTATKLLMGLIDPSTAPLRSPPRDVRQWAGAANASWSVALDNVSDIPPWLSDLLCKACTGDGHVDRALYSDDDVSVLRFRRVLALNGIALDALRGDLADRFLPVELAVITGDRRKGDEEVLTAAAAAYPRVLGALLDLLVEVLAILPNVRLATSPRMADFARALAALDKVTGWQTLDTFVNAANNLADTVIDSDQFAGALRDFIDAQGEFTTSVTDLHAAIPIPDPKPRTWPKTTQGARDALRRAAPALRQCGYVLNATGEKDPKTRRELWYFAAPPPERRPTTEKGAGTSFDPSHPSEPQVTAPKDADTDPSHLAESDGVAPGERRMPEGSFADPSPRLASENGSAAKDAKDPNDGSHLLSGPPARVTDVEQVVWFDICKNCDYDLPNELSGEVIATCSICGAVNEGYINDPTPGVQRCTHCRRPLDPALSAAGDTTHPGCAP